MTYQYPHTARKQVEEFFSLPVTNGDPIGQEVSFLTVELDNTYVRTGIVYDMRYDEGGVKYYSLMTSEGFRYHKIMRHHIRGI